MLRQSAPHEQFASRPFASADVAAVFNAWPDALRIPALRLRALIFEVGERTKQVGRLHETLKWRMPAYVSTEPKSGTTIRLEANAKTGTYGLFVPCRTSLIEQCRQLYSEKFVFAKNRGLIFSPRDEVPLIELRHFIAMALTYHLQSGPKDAALLQS